MKLNVTPISEKCTKFNLKNIGKKTLKSLGVAAMVGTGIMAAHDIGACIYNSTHNKEYKPLWSDKYLVDPISENVKFVRESYDARQELKARGINVRFRDARETLKTIEFDEAVALFNQNPDKYAEMFKLNPSTMSILDDNQKAILVQGAKMLVAMEGLQTSQKEVANSLNELLEKLGAQPETNLLQLLEEFSQEVEKNIEQQ